MYWRLANRRKMFWPAPLLIGMCLASASSAGPRPLIVLSENYPPFEYAVNGVATGINVAVMTRIFGSLRIPFEVRFYPFARQWMLAEKGLGDAMTSISYKADREAVLFYTPEQKDFATSGCVPNDYLWITDYAFFVDRALEKALRFESLAQVKRDGYRVGTIAQYAYTPEFLSAGLNTTMFPGAPEAFAGLLDGSIQMFPFDRMIGRWILREQGLADKVTCLPLPVFSKPYLLAFSRVSGYPNIEKVMSAFYTGLAGMRASGEYGQICARNGVDPGNMTRPLLFVAEQWPPFEFADDQGRMRGVDVEVVGRIMQDLGTPFSIRLYPWTRAWTMVQKGAADAVLSLSYSPSREDVLCYSHEQRAFATTGKTPSDMLWLAEYVFFVKADRKDAIRFDSLAQIATNGVKIGVNRSYTYSPEFVAAHIPSVEFNCTRDGFRALANNEIDAYPMDRTVGDYELSKMGLSKSITHLPKVIFSKPYLAVFSKHSTYPGVATVRDAFQERLRQMRASGECDRIRANFTTKDTR